MKKLSLFVLCLLVLAAPGFAADTISALIISGDDVSPYHDWKDIGQSTREVLEESGQFEVRVCEDVFILESKTALKNYDVIVMTRFHRGQELTQLAKDNLLDFVKGGKGFVVTHLASASFKEWDEFRDLCGRVWVMGTSGHKPRRVFEAKIQNAEHPITKGSESFKIFDELYSKLQGDADIEVLVDAYSKFSEKNEPLCFIREYGKGRVFHSAFGHDYKAIKNDSYAKLLAQGTEWAATGDVK